jgi:hypothetical protein
MSSHHYISPTGTHNISTISVTPIIPISASETSDSSVTVATQQINAIITQIVSQISLKQVPNTSNLLSYVTQIMELIELIPNLTSAQKLYILGQVISSIIGTSNIPDTEKVSLQALASILIPTFASIVCSAASGNLNINKVCTSCVGCFK